ncbi:MAG: D-hexose-6-phosphate mutarotase [Massilia sp.]|nr:D-hexose-6-phosphate mutarotase [Massilia sp.]
MTMFGSLPAVKIRALDGARAVVTLFAAHLVSWTTADGAEQLFCSSRSSLDGSRAIRGGVPVIFPQFNERGPIMRHGFARMSTWQLVDSGDGFAVLALAPADLTPERAAEWPHAFALRLRVQVGGAQLAMTLEVDNTGDAPFDFSAALHTYHRVADVAAVRIDGVREQTLQVGESLDAIYGDVGDVTLVDGARTVFSSQTGFTDAVVWNPGQAASAAMADMAPDEYRQFVCIEPAVIEPVRLAAGGQWRGHNVLRVTVK